MKSIFVFLCLFVTLSCGNEFSKSDFLIYDLASYGTACTDSGQCDTGLCCLKFTGTVNDVATEVTACESEILAGATVTIKKTDLDEEGTYGECISGAIFLQSISILAALAYLFF